jgi:DNA adenine methylase
MKPDDERRPATSRINPPLKWHIDGGKAYLAKRIVAMMPPRCANPNKPDPADPGWLHYVEPYAGGLSVLLANDPEGISEVANDLDHELTRFWQILQCPGHFEEFRRRVETTPMSEWEWENARKQFACSSQIDEPDLDPVERAALWFVRCRQSLAGRMKGFTGVTRTRTRRGMSNEVSAWLSAVEGLPAVHARLQRVLILSRDALEVIRGQDGPRTLFYLDPPYLHETRVTTGEYAHEMDAGDHAALLDCLGGLRGKFILSGYPSALYESYRARHGWTRTDIDIANHAAGGTSKRRMVECLWTNYPPHQEPP